MTLSEAPYSLHSEPCQYSVRVITSLSQRYTLFQYPFLSTSLFVKCTDSEAAEVSRCAHTKQTNSFSWEQVETEATPRGKNATLHWEPDK